MTKEYTIKGINDEADSCECCGKQGLRRVVWLEDSEGYVGHFGTTCAAKLRNVTVKAQKADEKAFQGAKEQEHKALISRVWDTLAPFRNQAQAVVSNCPYGPDEYQKRMSYIKEHKDTKMFGIQVELFAELFDLNPREIE